MDKYTAKYACDLFGVGRTRWRRWARAVLGVDDTAGRCMGVARVLSRKEFIKVAVIGFVVEDLNTTFDSIIKHFKSVNIDTDSVVIIKITEYSQYLFYLREFKEKYNLESKYEQY